MFTQSTTQTYRSVAADLFESHPFQVGQPHKLSDMLLAPVGSNGKHHKEMCPSYDPAIHPDLSMLGVRPFNRTHVVGAFFDADLKTADHENGISEAELEYLKKQLLDQPFKVIISTSKSGKGIHIFVVTKPIPHAGVDDAKRIIKEVVAEVFQYLSPKAAKLIDVSANNLVLWASETTAESFQLVGDNVQEPLEFSPTPAPATTPAPAATTNDPDIYERLTTQSQITLSRNQERLLAKVAEYGTVKPAEVPSTFYVNPHTLKLCMESENLSGDFDTVSDGSSEYTYCHLIAQRDGEIFQVVSARGNPETENWKNKDGKNISYFPYRETKNTFLGEVDSTVRVIGNTFYIRQTKDVGGRSVEFWQAVTMDAARLRCNQKDLDPKVALDLARYHSWSETTIPFKEVPDPTRRVMNPTANLDFVVDPSEGPTSTWDAMLAHTGVGLDNAVAANQFCQQHNITTGGEYLFAYLAWTTQQPTARPPGLAFYGPVLSGKSAPCEALRFIIQPNLIFPVGSKLRNDFNGQQGKAVFWECSEVDLRAKDNVEFAKDILTSPTVCYVKKGQTARTMPNVSRIYLTTNTLEHVPLGEDDVRWVVAECKPLPEVDTEFEVKLKSQAPAFLHKLLSYKLPPKAGRLVLPVLETELKKRLADSLVEDAPEIQQLITYLKDPTRKKDFDSPLTSADLARLLSVRSSGLIAKQLQSENVKAFIGSCGFSVTASSVKDANYRTRLAFEFKAIENGGGA